MDVDLNIDNYDFDDLLNLFNLNYNFNEKELKKAKRSVLMTHPDKSGLDKSYFMFFTKAYKMLSQIYYFRGKKQSRAYDKTYKTDDMEHLELIKGLDGKSISEFNKWFNKMFDNVKLADDEMDSGYGDWMKNAELRSMKNVKQSDFGREFEKRKQECKDLIVHREVGEIHTRGGSNLTRDRPELYNSEIFSKLKYEDLRRAHTETVVPVTQEDYDKVKKFNSIEEYQTYRNSSYNTTPLSKEESQKYLNERDNKRNEKSMRRAYNLLKREEEMEQAQEKWWKNFKRLKG
tara:strand:+ start:2184 stop:3050 length:867 start_codon:yes stop_codon:yes gene_type:complete